jgi:hypothetical protein
MATSATRWPAGRLPYVNCTGDAIRVARTFRELCPSPRCVVGSTNRFDLGLRCLDKVPIAAGRSIAMRRAILFVLCALVLAGLHGCNHSYWEFFGADSLIKGSNDIGYVGDQTGDYRTKR